MKRKRPYWLLIAIALLIALAPVYVSVHPVEGYSDATSFLQGDGILVNKAPYDVRWPSSRFLLFPHAHPTSGDVVIYREPGNGNLIFKRVIGCPGDTVAMKNNLLIINGRELTYQEAHLELTQPLKERNHLGSMVVRELGNGQPHLVSFTPGMGSWRTFASLVIPQDCHFVLGDNRDQSEDSRVYRPIPRISILGRVGTVVSLGVSLRSE